MFVYYGVLVVLLYMDTILPQRGYMVSFLSVVGYVYIFINLMLTTQVGFPSKKKRHRDAKEFVNVTQPVNEGAGL